MLQLGIIGQCKSGTTTQAGKFFGSCKSLVNLIVSDPSKDVERLKQVCSSAEQHLAVNNLLKKLNACSRPFEGLEDSHREYM
jgi:hypothetical protein